jgi:hypothetical protein
MFSIENSRDILLQIIKATRSMDFFSKEIWESRISHIYGDLKGQRSVDIIYLQNLLNDTKINLFEIIVSLETYYYIICNFIAISSLEKEPKKIAIMIKDYSISRKRTFLKRLLSGDLFTEKGIYGFTYNYDYSWIYNNEDINITNEIIRKLNEMETLWSDKIFNNSNCDPLQKIHHSIFPKNLIHITGQFYTPEWLAEYLLNESGWSPNKTLLDPFCGSGVFLNKAFEIAMKDKINIKDFFSNILGIDINPFACSAARANFVYNIGRFNIKNFDEVYLNIINADALVPAILKYPNNNLFRSYINVNGEIKKVNEFPNNNIFKKSMQYGLNLTKWIDYINDNNNIRNLYSINEKKEIEQNILFLIKKADFVLTNPPWIGWEYISKNYRNTIESAWKAYDLFEAKGLDAAFLKEDISNLSLLASWDLYLKDDAVSSVVLRPTTMHSNLTSTGIRRLSINNNGIDLKLENINIFTNIKIFEDANTETATWKIIKNKKTVFPIKVLDWNKKKLRWNPKSQDKLNNIKENITIIEKMANPTIKNDFSSRWYISESNESNIYEKIQGNNNYVPRMGVFTGGANAIFYLDIIKNLGKTSMCRNIIERAKIKVPIIESEIENECIYDVIRGRDIQMWYNNSNSSILCTHTKETKMYPLSEENIKNKYPLTYAYLISMKKYLINRNGFANWEKNILEKYFYCLQRIGEYTFAPYKVCWKYISSEFIISVVESNGKKILPNDKVMFIPFNDKMAAYFVAGILSSDIIRKYINSLINKRQISTSVIESLFIPLYDHDNELHFNISNNCLLGHKWTLKDDLSKLEKCKLILNENVNELYQI